MRRRRPVMLYVAVADRGHVPFLGEPEATRCMQAWLKRICDNEAVRP